jgi:hypothetical protein
VNNSECVFTVSDPDGWLNLMDFTEFSDSSVRNNFSRVGLLKKIILAEQHICF